MCSSVCSLCVRPSASPSMKRHCGDGGVLAFMHSGQTWSQFCRVYSVALLGLNVLTFGSRHKQAHSMQAFMVAEPGSKTYLVVAIPVSNHGDDC